MAFVSPFLPLFNSFWVLENKCFIEHDVWKRCYAKKTCTKGPHMLWIITVWRFLASLVPVCTVCFPWVNRRLSRFQQRLQSCSLFCTLLVNMKNKGIPESNSGTSLFINASGGIQQDNHVHTNLITTLEHTYYNSPRNWLVKLVLLLFGMLQLRVHTSHIKSPRLSFW